MSAVHFYRKKPVTVRAAKLTEDNIDDLAEWCGGNRLLDFDTQTPVLEVPTELGNLLADMGDYVTEDVEGKYHIHKAADFDAAYERA